MRPADLADAIKRGESFVMLPATPERAVNHAPKMIRRAPAFGRANIIAELVRRALAMPSIVEQRIAMLRIPEYRSRGKGRGTPSRRYGNPIGKYMPHQGERECARRRRQMGISE